MLTKPLLLAAAMAPLAAPGESRPPGRAPAQEHAAEGEQIERHLTAMGTTLSLSVLAADRGAALRASEVAVRAIESAEARLSTWSRDSELAHINAAPVDEAQPLSPTLAGELSRVFELRRRTGGAFDPCVGALVVAYDLRGGGRWPSEPELELALAASAAPALRIDGTGATRLHEGLVLEEGGFGKGAGLDAALARLAASGAQRAVLDLGGQVALFDADPAPERERIELAHPSQRDTGVLALEVPPGSLATTGNSERGRTVDGRSLGHVLDPRSGRPARDFGSLTVWCPSALDADALSTGLYVLGPDAALAHAAQHEGVEVIALVVVDPDHLEVHASAGWRGHASTLTDARVTFHGTSD